MSAHICISGTEKNKYAHGTTHGVHDTYETRLVILYSRSHVLVTDEVGNLRAVEPHDHN